LHDSAKSGKRDLKPGKIEWSRRLGDVRSVGIQWKP
jgi:hypothetical protein